MCPLWQSCPQDFIHSLLCVREDGDSYHKMACVEGKCAHCGSLAKFPTPDVDFLEDEIVSWQHYDYHIYTGQSGASSRRLQLTPHSGPRPAFVSSFSAAIYSYLHRACTWRKVAGSAVLSLLGLISDRGCSLRGRFCRELHICTAK